MAADDLTLKIEFDDDGSYPAFAHQLPQIQPTPSAPVPTASPEPFRQPMLPGFGQPLPADPNAIPAFAYEPQAPPRPAIEPTPAPPPPQPTQRDWRLESLPPVQMPPIGPSGAAGAAEGGAAEAGMAGAGAAGGAAEAAGAGLAAGAALVAGPMLIIGAAVTAAATAVTAFKGVVEDVVQRGKELAQYSPELAGAGARQEIANTLSDIKEAQELGSGITRMTDAQTEIMTAIRDLLLPLKKLAIDILAPVLETVADFISWIRDLVENFFASWKVQSALQKEFWADEKGKAKAREETDEAIKGLHDLAKAREDREKAKADGPGQMFDKQMEALMAAALSIPGIGMQDPILGDPGAI